MIELLRNQIDLSFMELEEALWTAMRREFGEACRLILELLDDLFKTLVDSSTYEVKGLEPRSLVSLLGTDVSFKRRRYRNRETGEYVYLLDEVLELPDRERISPGLKATILTQAVTTNSYRKAAESIEALVGFPAVSHETVRQVVKGVGAGVEQAIEESLEEPQGGRKVRILFAEVDGLGIPLQRANKRSLEEKVLTLHEGWEPRYPKSKEYRLVGLKQFRTNAEDFWEQASRFAYSHYDIDENTIVIINGDRAHWIRKGVEYFPNSMYQFDRWHLVRDLRRRFLSHPKVLNAILEAWADKDTTGATFLAELAKGINVLGPKHKEQALRFLKDLVTVPEATVDYRERLKALGVSVDGFRGLGAAESQMDRFSDRMKGGRSWSAEGEAAMMEILCARYSGYFGELVGRLEEWCDKNLRAPISIKAVARRAAKSVLSKLPGIKSVRTPISSTGMNASGGLSNLMHRINESGLPVGG